MKKIFLSSVLLISILLCFIATIEAQEGNLLRLDIQAPSLANNKLKIPSIQPIAVYLPPSYYTSAMKYPVLYFLPGFGDQVSYWLNGTYQGFNLKTSMDKLINTDVISEFIVVIAGGYNFMGGSFYVNSSVTGNWEDFIVKDVVGYIDNNYRTLAGPESRAISGHSMGGFGSLNLAMRHPDVFGMVYALSPGLFDKKGITTCQLFKSQNFILQFIQKEQEFSVMTPGNALTAFKSYLQSRLSANDWDTPFTYAYGAAFSPNPNKNVPYTDYPYYMSGTNMLKDDTIMKNYENGFGGLDEKINLYKSNLLKLKFITIDYGLVDEYYWISQGCPYFSGLLTSAGIKNNLVTFSGGHQDQVRSRIESFLLPAVSKNLKYYTGPAGIKLNDVIPGKFNLDNFPNPFNSSTTICFNLPGPQYVSIKIYNSLGQQIYNPVEEYMQQGYYTVNWNFDSLTSGTYVCRMQSGTNAISKKLMLMK